MSILAECKGCRISALDVPPFVVKKGGVTTLDWPKPFGGEEERVFCEALAKTREIPGLEVQVGAAIVAPFAEPFLSSSFESLARKLATNEKEAVTQVQKRAGASPDTVMMDIPLTDRSIAAMVVACACSPFVVFNTTGLDVAGEDAVLSMVRDQAKNGHGLFHLRFPSKRFRPIGVRSLMI